MSTNTRYGLGSTGALTFAIEDEPYDQEDDPDTEFGITSEDIEPWNENPHTGMPHGGHGRTPYVQSPDPKEPEFDVPSVLHSPDIPLEIAIGDRETTDEGNYTAHVFTEADRLDTATIRHIQPDIGLVAYYVGCKADPTIEWSQGDPVEISLAVTAAEHVHDPDEPVPSFDPTLPTDVSPFRAHMQGNLTVEDQDSSLVTEVATVTGGSWGIGNGLEHQHHGGDGEGANRSAYSVAETTAADKYDLSLDLNVTDTDLYEECVQNDRLLDAEIPFVRQYDDSAGEIVDGLILRASETPIIEQTVERPSEGVVEGTVGLQPQGGVEIEIREPNT